MRYGLSISLLAAVLALVALGAAPETALAQDEVVDACVHQGSGVLYLREDRGSAGDTCTNRDQEIQWNQQGPAGPQGPPGISGYEIVRTECSEGGNCSPSVAAICPTGKRVLGGGYEQSDVGQSFDSGTVNPDYVGPSEDGTRWKVEGPQAFFATHFPSSASIVVYAICATVETAE